MYQQEVVLNLGYDPARVLQTKAGKVLKYEQSMIHQLVTSSVNFEPQRRSMPSEMI